MGFTYYWDVTRTTSPSSFKKLCEVAGQLHSDVEVTDTTFVVYFDDAEWIEFSNAVQGWQFCKTNRGPDDLPACAILRYAKQIYQDGIDVSCDDDTEEYLSRGDDLLKGALEQIAALKIQKALKAYYAKRTAAARIIQARWEATAYDPARPLCVSRLTKKISMCPLAH